MRYRTVPVATDVATDGVASGADVAVAFDATSVADVVVAATTYNVATNDASNDAIGDDVVIVFDTVHVADLVVVAAPNGVGDDDAGVCVCVCVCACVCPYVCVYAR